MIRPPLILMTNNDRQNLACWGQCATFLSCRVAANRGRLESVVEVIAAHPIIALDVNSSPRAQDQSWVLVAAHAKAR
jgi:hypothetical protein